MLSAMNLCGCDWLIFSYIIVYTDVYPHTVIYNDIYKNTRFVLKKHDTHGFLAENRGGKRAKNKAKKSLLFAKIIYCNIQAIEYYLSYNL